LKTLKEFDGTVLGYLSQLQSWMRGETLHHWEKAVARDDPSSADHDQALLGELETMRIHLEEIDLPNRSYQDVQRRMVEIVEKLASVYRSRLNEEARPRQADLFFLQQSLARTRAELHRLNRRFYPRAR